MKNGRLLKFFLTGIVPLIILGGAFLIGVVHNLSAPQKRPLHDYHYSWLNTPEEHSIRYENKGVEIPYLVVEPKSGEPAKRGQMLRKQLSEGGVVIESFGVVDQHLVLLHGRKGRKEDMLPISERYCAVGYRCIIPDLPAHGENSIKRAYFGTGEEERAHLISIIKAEEGLKEFTKKPILWGMSMGGSYAAQLAGNHEDVFSKVILVNTFDCLENVVRHKCKSSLVGNLIKKVSKGLFSFNIEKANSSMQIAKTTLPLLIAHGTDDELIPFELGERLFKASSSPKKKWITVKGANHDTILVTDHPLFAETTVFLKSE